MLILCTFGFFSNLFGFSLFLFVSLVVCLGFFASFPVVLYMKFVVQKKVYDRIFF